MKKKRFFKILLWKAYFDTGFGLLNYLKYVVAVVGVNAIFKGVSLFWILLIAFSYGVLCLVVGRIWFHFHLVDTENEIRNIFNPFCREVRKNLNRKIYK